MSRFESFTLYHIYALLQYSTLNAIQTNYIYIRICMYSVGKLCCIFICPTQSTFEHDEQSQKPPNRVNTKPVIKLSKICNRNQCKCRQPRYIASRQVENGFTDFRQMWPLAKHFFFKIAISFNRIHLDFKLENLFTSTC